MIVCIAEKPSVARDIANVLGAKDMKQGYIEGNGYQVTWTFGHLCELKNPHEYFERWKRWDLWDLPMIPARFGIRLKDDDGVKRQFATIEKLMQAADSIINCGDAGQEGELIQRWVMQKAGAKCPVKRLWISSLTEEAIREGFNNLKDQIEYQSLYEAGLCRAIGDWTLGMNATRLYTLKYGQEKQVLSVGRVQTPTLALIVRRQQEIESFVPKQSWVLSTLYRDTKFTAIAHDEEAEAEDAAEVKAAAEEGKTIKSKGPIYKQIEFLTEEEGRAVLQSIEGQPFTVTDIQKKKGTEAPPRLYDLTSLQVDCNRKFGYSAEQTLQLIQSLYEKKFTTYPRVDTTFLSDDIYAKCPQTLRGLKGYEQFTQPLEGKPLPKSKKVFDSSKVTDHHAIIPTGVPAISLTDMERRVYDLVARAFIAVFYPDCKFETTTVFGEVKKAPSLPSSERALSSVAPDSATFSCPVSSLATPKGEGEPSGVLFRTSGKVIIDDGWKIIYKGTPSEESDENTQDGNSSPLGEAGWGLGESGPHFPSLSEKWTQPPKPYTEATLLRAMETAGKFVDNEELRDAMKENGIGRPSTRAAIIETLFKRRYIRKERKSLVATPTGVELIGIIHEELLKSAELTGIWEKKLREIEKKQYDAKTFIEELKQMVTDIVNQVRNDNSNRRVAVTTEADLKKKKAKPASQPSNLNAPAGFQPNPRAGRSSKPRNAQSQKPKTTEEVKAEHNPDEVIGMPCPICHEGHIIKGKTAYGCSRWKEGCTYRLPFDQA